MIYCVLFMEWEYGPQPFDGVCPMLSLYIYEQASSTRSLPL